MSNTQANAELTKTAAEAKRAYDRARGQAAAAEMNRARESMLAAQQPKPDLIPIEPPSAHEQALIAERGELEALVSKALELHITSTTPGIHRLHARIERLRTEIEELATIRAMKQQVAIVAMKIAAAPKQQFYVLRNTPKEGDRVVLVFGFITASSSVMLDGTPVTFADPLSFVSEAEAAKLEAAINAQTDRDARRYTAGEEPRQHELDAWRYAIVMPPGATLADCLRARIELDKRTEKMHPSVRSWLGRLTPDALAYLDADGEIRKSLEGGHHDFQ